MLDERHVRELCEKNHNIDINDIREKLNSIRKLSERVVQKLQTDNGLEPLKSEITSNSDWVLALALCELCMNKVRRIQLRDVQLVPIIFYFINGFANNIFIEVLSGEGKTMIISVIAAIHVLLGRKVDIITTTDVLAEANNKDMAEFYESLGISSTTNMQSDERTYKKNIVYGTMFHFGKDFLKDWLAEVACGLCARTHKICIIDEFDLLALDNADHLVKVAEPFPGMEMLRYPPKMLNKEDSSTLPKHLERYSKFMENEWYSISKNTYKYEYIKENDKIIPIDPQSGMIMRGAVFPNGAQQIIERGKGCPITIEILNSITISNFGYIKMYDSLCGLTGTLGDVRELEVLLKIFNGASYYRIPPYYESKLQYYIESFPANIKYLNKVTNDIAYETKLSTNTVCKDAQLITSYRSQEGVDVKCACLYRNNKLTQTLVELNQILIENAHAHPNRNNYNMSMENLVKTTIDKYRFENIILISISSLEYIEQTFRSHERVVVINDIKLLDKYDNNVKLFIFNVTFNEKLAMNNGLIMFNNNRDRIDVLSLVHDYLIRGRSVLIICEKNRHVTNLAYNLFNIRFITSRFKITTYIGVQEEGPDLIQNINPIEPGVIILTTLIGARGTDYQITDELAQNGGLHVICTFMPPNNRIQQQVFGRVARNGQPGSAQIVYDLASTWVVKDSDVIERDEIYSTYLKNICEKIQRLTFYDAMHEQFRQFILNMRRTAITSNKVITSLMIEELIEYWGFWLKYKQTDKIGLKANDKFKQFQTEAEHIINFNGYHNPVYAAKMANYYFSQGEHERASEIIIQTLDDTGFCKALILEYVNFARNAIQTRNACELAKEALTKVKDNQFNIEVYKYITVIENQMEMLDSIKEAINRQTFTKTQILASNKTAGVLFSTSVAALRKFKLIDCVVFTAKGISHMRRRRESADVLNDLKECGEYIGEVCKHSQIAASIVIVTYSSTFDKLLSNLKLACNSPLGPKHEQEQKYEDLKDAEMVLKVIIDDIVDTTLGRQPLAITQDEVKSILDNACSQWINFYGDNETICNIAFKEIINKQKCKFIKPIFNALHHKEMILKMTEIVSLVQLCCTQIKEMNDKTLKFTKLSFVEFDEIKILFDHIPSTFKTMIETEIQIQTAIQHQVEIVQSC